MTKSLKIDIYENHSFKIKQEEEDNDELILCQKLFQNHLLKEENKRKLRMSYFRGRNYIKVSEPFILNVFERIW